MPWLETRPVEQHERFIADHRHGLFSMAELCARYRISRKTGYKWLARYDAGGKPALRDRSHAPHACPHRLSADVAVALCAARRAHPSWEPAKLLDWLALHRPELPRPAASTAGAARRSTRASCRRPPSRLTTCGRSTSKGSSAHATRSTATR